MEEKTSTAATTTKHIRPKIRSRKKPPGILKESPKYSGGDAIETTKSHTAGPDVIPDDDIDLPFNHRPLPPAVVKDTVLERPRRKRDSIAKKTPLQSPVAVEGYASKLKPAPAAAIPDDHQSGKVQWNIDQDKDNLPPSSVEKSGPLNVVPEDGPTGDSTTHDSEEPLVVNSLSDLMKAAGTLPDQNISGASMIEADVSFSCMDPESYETQREEELQEHYNVMLGTGLGGGSLDDDDDKENSADDESDDGGFWDLVGEEDDEDDDDDDPVPAVEPGSFLELWDMIKQWVTPDAVKFVRDIRECEGRDFFDHNAVVQSYDQSDVGLSRCAGLLALLQMHITQIVVELKQPVERTRYLQQRLLNLLRTFDYSQPSPKLTLRMTKALCCIMMRTVLICDELKEDDGRVPESCCAAGLKKEEYEYIGCKAFLAFESI